MARTLQAAVGVGLLLAGCATPALGEAPAGPSRVRVHFPAGGCETGQIEIEVFDRHAKAWQPHPSHARVEAGTCHLEEPGVLLNEIRVRCIDPAGRSLASDWVVGARLVPAAGPDPCPAPTGEEPDEAE